MSDLTPEMQAELRRAALIEGHDAAHYPTSVVVPTRTLLALLDAAAERDRLAEAVRAYVDDWDLLVEEMRQTGLDEVVLTMTPVGEVTS